VSDIETRVTEMLKCRANAVTPRGDLDAVTRRAGSPMVETRDRGPRWAVVAAGVAAVAVIGLVLVGLREGGSSAWAGWLSTPMPASDDDAALLTQECRSEFSIDPAAKRLAVDIRGQGGVAVFDDGTWCAADRVEGEFEISNGDATGLGGSLSLAREQVSPANPVVVIGGAWGGQPPSGILWGVRDISVTRITMDEVAGGVVEMSLHDNIWVGWWPNGDTETEDSVLRAYAADETVIAQGNIDELSVRWPRTDTEIACENKDPACIDLRLPEILDYVATSGSTVEKEALTDGVVTEAEYRIGVDAVLGCFAEHDYPEITAVFGEDGVAYQSDGTNGMPDAVFDACQQRIAAIDEVWELQLLFD
jgi:hypothetical protein